MTLPSFDVVSVAEWSVSEVLEDQSDFFCESDIALVSVDNDNGNRVSANGTAFDFVDGNRVFGNGNAFDFVDGN